VLIIAIFLFVVLSAVIAIRTPAWESSDEPGHVQNIETLVGGHWYRMGPNTGNEAHQAPLYYIVMATWQRVSGQPARIPNPGDATFANHRSRGLFLHHTAADHRFLLWLRLPNVLLGAATILLTALAVRRLTSDPWTPVVAASIVAFTPRFVFLSAFVTNDNLVNLLGALLTFLAVGFLDRPTVWRIAAVGGTV